MAGTPPSVRVWACHRVHTGTRPPLPFALPSCACNGAAQTRACEPGASMGSTRPPALCVRTILRASRVHDPGASPFVCHAHVVPHPAMCEREAISRECAPFAPPLLVSAYPGASTRVPRRVTIFPQTVARGGRVALRRGGCTIERMCVPPFVQQRGARDWYTPAPHPARPPPRSLPHGQRSLDLK